MDIGSTFKDLRVDYLGYEVVPSAYLVCTEDMAIPGFFQVCAKRNDIYGECINGISLP